MGTARRGLQGGETAKQCKVCWNTHNLAEHLPPTLAKTQTFGDPEDQNKESQEKKKATKVFSLCKNQRPYKSLTGTNSILNGQGVGLGVLARSLQLTPTNLEPSMRRKGERELESARNEIPSLIPHAGSLLAFSATILNTALRNLLKIHKHPQQ